MLVRAYFEIAENEYEHVVVRLLHCGTNQSESVSNPSSGGDFLCRPLRGPVFKSAFQLCHNHSFDHIPPVQRLPLLNDVIESPDCLLKRCLPIRAMSVDKINIV